jgi:carboxyl-terminal processing protease
MLQMTSSVRRWVACVLVAMGSAAMTAPAAWAQAAEDQLALADDLRHQAFEALRAGQFDKTNTLLSKAAELSKDPLTQQMAAWVLQFEQQRVKFVGERREQFDKAVGDVKLLLDKGYRDYALDAVARAYLLAEDKTAFRAEPWVDALVNETIAAAKEYETKENWVRATRLYSALGSVEPANPVWKDELKGATRRIRLLALYSPDYLKQVQESESAEREAVAALLKPTTQPTTQQAKKDEDDTDAFRIDWHDTLRDIKPKMLEDAIFDARQNYWRDLTYRDLLVGGLQGVEALVTTKGLENTFPALKDEEKRAAFAATVGQMITELKASPDADDASAVARTLRRLELANLKTLQLDEEVVVSEFADGAFGTLDPFSSVIWPSDLEEFQKTTQGEFSGVGIQIQSDDDGSLRVVSPLEDSPAYRAGIKAGDVVTHIDGKSAKGITLNQAVKNITGIRGTTVVLSIKSEDGGSKDYSIIRDTIKVASVKGWQHRPGGGWDYFVDAENKIGYIRLTNFTKTTSEDLSAALKDMKQAGAKGLILDLRYNPGGLLQAATEVVDRFIADGTIVSTRADRRTPNGPTVAPAKEDGDEIDLPTVVLVNQYSASASEIVSGALKDHGKALVIGERTFGKGSVQMLFPLYNRRAYLKLTTSHYYLPNGKCIHRDENSQEWGVDPDVTIEMTPEQMRAAIDARQDLDVLRDNPQPAGNEQDKLRDEAGEVKEAVAEVKERKDPLQSDPQLSAALLYLRLSVAQAAM